MQGIGRWGWFLISPTKEKRTLQSATQWLHSEMMSQFLKVAGKKNNVQIHIHFGWKKKI